jgi:type 1 fimbria pilin
MSQIKNNSLRLRIHLDRCVVSLGGFLLLTLLLLLTDCFAEEQPIGEALLKFSGEVYEASCRLPDNADRIEIDLPTVHVSKMQKTGHSSTPKLFTLDFTACHRLVKHIEMRIFGIPDDRDPKIFKNLSLTLPTAQGIGVRIVNADTNEQWSPAHKDQVDVYSNTAQLKLRIDMVATQDNATYGNVFTDIGVEVKYR